MNRDFLLHHLLRAASEVKKEALVYGDQRLTYDDLALHVASVAYHLRNAELSRGGRVGIYLDPSVPQVLSILGISQAGGVFVPVNHMLLPDQVSHIMTDS